MASKRKAVLDTEAGSSKRAKGDESHSDEEGDESHSDEEDYEVPLAYPADLPAPTVDFSRHDYVTHLLSLSEPEGLRVADEELNKQQARDAMMLLPVPKPWTLIDPYAPTALGDYGRFAIKQGDLAIWNSLVTKAVKPFKVKHHVFKRLPKTVRGRLPRQRNCQNHYGEATLCTIYKEVNKFKGTVQRLVVKPTAGHTDLKPALLFDELQEQEYNDCLRQAKSIHNMNMQHMYHGPPGLFGVK